MQINLDSTHHLFNPNANQSNVFEHAKILFYQHLTKSLFSKSFLKEHLKCNKKFILFTNEHLF